jgi:hypothetical protein
VFGRIHGMHHPFLINGKRKWVRYQDQEIEQKQLISNTLNEIVWPHAFGEYLLRVSVSHVRTFQHIRQYL